MSKTTLRGSFLFCYQTRLAFQHIEYLFDLFSQQLLRKSFAPLYQAHKQKQTLRITIQPMMNISQIEILIRSVDWDYILQLNWIFLLARLRVVCEES